MKRVHGTLGALAFAVFFAGASDVAAESKKEEAVKYQKVLASSKDPKDRAIAFLELGKLSQVQVELAKPAVPAFFDGLKDKNSDVRAAAAEGIGMIDVEEKKEIVKALIELLKNDKVTKVKEGAAKGLGNVGTDAKDAIPALKDAQKAAVDAGKKQDGRVYQEAMAKINKK